MAQQFASIDEYIDTFPEDVRAVLREVRLTIQKAVPKATETISYNMPTFALEGRNLVHFAGWKRHISLYPVPAADGEFERRLAPYLAGKGTVKFPLNEPIPYDLIRQVVLGLRDRTT